MKQEGNFIYADEGKTLLTPMGYKSVIALGDHTKYSDGKATKYHVSIDNVFEVYPVNIGNEVFYLDDISDYGKVVTALIRKKYSLDDELAITANVRCGNNSQEEAFQSWRQSCKEAAKKLVK